MYLLHVCVCVFWFVISQFTAVAIDVLIHAWKGVSFASRILARIFRRHMMAGCHVLVGIHSTVVVMKAAWLCSVLETAWKHAGGSHNILPVHFVVLKPCNSAWVGATSTNERFFQSCDVGDACLFRARFGFMADWSLRLFRTGFA